MENLRRGENRKGQSHNIPDRPAQKDEDQAPKGFEGMNFEQKRKPYIAADRSDKDWDRVSGNDIKRGRRRDDN